MAMKVSLTGMFCTAEMALRSSSDDYACVSAYSIGVMIDNLRLLKDGKCSVDEFFDLYVFSDEENNLADLVIKEKYLCMKEDGHDAEDC
jgi:hypothetical protein